MAAFVTHRFPLALLLLALVNLSTFAQQKAAPISSSCNADAAVELIQQQLAETKTFDDAEARIRVVIRAADLLWGPREPQARAAFVEAFDLARQYYKEKGDDPRQEGQGLMVTTPDPRYTVIRAIAKRDSEWARRLTEELIKDQLSQAKEEGLQNGRDARTAEKMLSLATSLLNTDLQMSLNVATQSLKFPATMYLSMFFYQLAEVNRPAADQLYQAAIAAYAKAPMNRFLYLSSFPFGLSEEVGQMPGSTHYEVPAGFRPDPTLQRLFTEILLTRAQEEFSGPSLQSPDSGLSDSEQIVMALRKLDRRLASSLPDLSARAEQARTQITSNLPVGLSTRANPPERVQGSFREQVEAAEKKPDVNERDRLLSFAAIGAPPSEDLEFIISAVDKISDSQVRRQLLNWLYFNRSLAVLKRNAFADARALAAKVDELDQRSYLYFRIAEESLKQNEDQSQAREMLEEVITAALKSPTTLVSARTQLGVAYLYTKIDVPRAIAVLADAVKTINRLESPDFSRQYVLRRIEGKTFSSYAAFVTPGFSPESAFKEMAKSDFDGTLYQANTFASKPLRALTTLTVIEPCLKIAKPPLKSPAKPKPLRT
jgi:hypothetical protein